MNIKADIGAYLDSYATEAVKAIHQGNIWQLLTPTSETLWDIQQARKTYEIHCVRLECQRWKTKNKRREEHQKCFLGRTAQIECTYNSTMPVNANVFSLCATVGHMSPKIGRRIFAGYSWRWSENIPIVIFTQHPYSTSIHVIGLSCTVLVQCTSLTDGQADTVLVIIANTLSAFPPKTTNRLNKIN